MKDTPSPSVRASSALRKEAETLLVEGKSIPGFFLTAVQHEVACCHLANGFLERGLQRSERPSAHVDATEVVSRLRGRLVTRLKDAK